MFHIVLRGWIESKDKDFVKQLEEYVNKEHNLKGVFDSYEIVDEDDKN